MPQPLSRVCPDGSVALSPDALVGNPQAAVLVTRIFGLWAVIEHELSLLMVRLLRAEEGPALAIYSIIRSDSLQTLVLNEAANAVFNGDEEELAIFSAVINIANSAGKIRHKLAHWRWGTCPELPGAILLADPKGLARLEKAHLQRRYRPDTTPLITLQDVGDWMRQFSFDRETILVYTVAELDSACGEMAEAAQIMSLYALYLNPVFSEEHIREVEAAHIAAGQLPPKHWLGTRAATLHQLSTLKLFREAHARLRQGKSNSPQTPP